MSLIYGSASLLQALVISDDVLSVFEKYRQSRGLPEAGGQLFATWDEERILIAKATGVRKGDKRKRYFFKPNRRLEQKEIEIEFSSGLHFVGDWHTHPQELPRPSSIDQESIMDCFIQSSHHLRGFFLIVVGLAPPPEGLWVGFHSEGAYTRLTAK